MLTVKTYLDKSDINGIGVFSSEKIRKGQIVWEYFPLVDITYTEKQWKSLKLNLTDSSFEMINRYAYKEQGQYIVCLDNAQFMNHSAQFQNVGNTPDLKSMYALKDIAEGQEILCNYFEYSDADDSHLAMLKM